MNEFRNFHNEMRQLRKPREFYPVHDEVGRLTFGHPRVPYRRPENPNEIQGKKNIRAAKRERVKALKEAQNAI